MIGAALLAVAEFAPACQLVWIILVSMSTANTIFNVITLAFSLTAIIVSVMSARRQSADASLANIVMFLNETGQKLRSQDFLASQDYVLTQLSKFNPSLGVYGLPEPARGHALQVGGFYQDLGVLVVSGVLDEDLAAAMYYAGIKDVWRALELFIFGEREIRHSRGAGGFYGSFEHIAAYVDLTPYEVLTKRRFRRRIFSTTRANSPADTKRAGSDFG